MCCSMSAFETSGCTGPYEISKHGRWSRYRRWHEMDSSCSSCDNHEVLRQRVSAPPCPACRHLHLLHPSLFPILFFAILGP